MNPLQSTLGISTHDVPSRVLHIIASELHVPVDDLKDDDIEFSELGVDALVAPPIIGKIAQATALQLPEDIFETFGTIAPFKKHIATLAQKTQHLKAEPGPALSVLIRNSTAKNTKGSQNLFLLPDGSGAAMAYARIPALPNVRIYAMNSPFLHNADNYTCTIEQLASLWAEAIAEIQPRGPYMLGGWSAGGYYAYEVMRHLQRKGEVVDRLVLIDSPCRTVFEALPFEVVLYLASNGLMGEPGRNANNNKAAPQWLVDHFKATLRAVDAYRPEGIASGGLAWPSTPGVFIIWASEPLLEEGRAAAAGLDPNVKVTRLLLQSRSDFGPNGWDTLFPPGASVRVAVVSCNHFNIVHPPNASHPHVEKLGRLLRDVVHPEGEAAWVNEWHRVGVSSS
ncbi:Alpha/Beta hydrolase protein [Parachaetomium inaequale]|uniref:Alpha/Beta hydrolase protein n=1 Tax=Parachaetomium inaequale TaxID=2588326 RepID=A0AAN6PMT7_9PEZI|nr:Alpha/Beta hydrolase protein [Parachaetomium inaequale]